MLAEHTTNAEESLILQLQGMQTKSEAMRVDGVHLCPTGARKRARQNFWPKLAKAANCDPLLGGLKLRKLPPS